jgi:hypothetical protein
VPGDTDVLPLPDITDYSCDLDRCAVELSLCLLSFHLLRVRLRATSGGLSAEGALRLELAAAPVRANLPLVNRYFLRTIPGGVRLAVSCPNVELGSVLTRADGHVSVVRVGDDAEPPGWPVRLFVRAIRTGDSVLLAVRGRFPRPRKPSSNFLSALRPWMRVEAAVEFSR